MKRSPGRGPTRRTFLQTTAIAAAAPAIGSCATVVAGSAFQGGDLANGTIRVGLVGCGGRGTGAANQALHAEDGSVVLWSVGDLFPDRVDSCLESLRGALAAREEDLENGVEAMPDRTARLQVSEERSFVGFDAIDKVLASGVDVVILATPPVFRPDHLRAAVEAGVHVFAEKPFAVDAHGVRSALATSALAREKRLALVCGFCWRYNVRHRAFFERLQAGALGDVHAFYSTYNAGPPAVVPRAPGMTEMEWQVRNWKNCQWLSGDHITEQAVHSLDKQAWAFRDQAPLSVTAIGGRQARGGPENGNLFDHFSATFEYDGGAKGFHMARQMTGCDFDNTDHVYGTKGHGTINGWAPLHRLEGAETWEYEGDGNDMYQTEHDELFASLRAGQPINDGEWASTSSMLAIMTRMSAYTGRTITWEQAMNSEDRLGLDLYAMDAAPTLRPVATPGQTPFV